MFNTLEYTFAFFLAFFPIIRRAICRLYGELQVRGGRGRSAFIAADNMRFTRPIIGKTSFSITQLKIRPWYAFTTHLTFVTDLESFASSTECWFLPFSRKAGIWYSYPIALKASKTSLKPLSTTQTSPAWKNSFVSMIWRASSASLCLPSLWYGDS